MTPSDLKTQETSEGASLGSDSFTSYSLNFEDVILHRLFPVTQTGFYVDVGAGHPRLENDTFLLYQRGWRGINIEPNHGFHSALMEERPRDINLQVVLSDSSFRGTLIYYELNGSGLSTCDVEQAKAYQAAGRDIVLREVPVTTLSSVLTKARAEHINILKVDVEGFEEKVLNGNDWNKFRPDVVVVEATYPESPVRRPTGIPSLMEQRGYRHVYFDGVNDFYLERTFAPPEGLTLPPNVFDRFVPREIADLRIQVESLQINLKSAEEYAGALRLQTDNLISENRRLRRAVEQMRAELLVLNQLLEPLHAMTEQIEQQKAELVAFKEQLERQKADLLASKARLTSVYSSHSWLLTAPLRWCDGIWRRIAMRQKRLGVDN